VAFRVVDYETYSDSYDSCLCSLSYAACMSQRRNARVVVIDPVEGFGDCSRRRRRLLSGVECVHFGNERRGRSQVDSSSGADDSA